MFKVRHGFLLLVLALFDTFFAYAFPVDFTFQSMSFISHLCFMGLLIWTMQLEWVDRLLAGALCGLLFDFFFTSSFPTSFILYPLFTMVAGWLYQQLQEDVRIKYAIAIVGVVLLDWIPLIACKLVRIVQVSFGTWMIQVGLFTLLFHIVMIIGYHYLSTYMAENEKMDVEQGNRYQRKRVRRLRPMGK